VVARLRGNRHCERSEAIQLQKTVVARLDRAIQYAVAFRSISNASGILGRPVKPGDDSGVCFIQQGRP